MSLLPQNAVLTFALPVRDGEVETDVLGNPITATKAFKVTATLRPDEKAKYQSNEGLKPGQIRLTGRAIAPQFLPNGLPRECGCEINDPSTGQKLSGILVRDTPIQSKFVQVTKALGSKISGVFTEGAGHG